MEAIFFFPIKKEKCWHGVQCKTTSVHVTIRMWQGFTLVISCLPSSSTPQNPKPPILSLFDSTMLFSRISRIRRTGSNGCRWFLSHKPHLQLLNPPMRYITLQENIYNIGLDPSFPKFLDTLSLLLTVYY